MNKKPSGCPSKAYYSVTCYDKSSNSKEISEETYIQGRLERNMEHFIAVTCLVIFIATLSFCSGASIKSEDAPCRSEVSRIQKEHLENNFFLNYVVLPQCDKRGYYKAVQRTLDGFMCSTPNGTPVDYSYFTAQGPCRRLQQCVKHYQSEGANDHNLIRCDKFGYFKIVQRTETGKICVAVYGKIFKTTNVSRKRDCYDAIFRH